MEKAAIRTFETGATRDVDNSKFDYEGFLSPLVIERFGAYMHKNRTLRDGSLRDSDNWQKGMPLDAYMKSGFRHFFDWWKNHRKLPAADLEESLCALLFNVQGYLHEMLKAKTQTATKTPIPGAIYVTPPMPDFGIVGYKWVKTTYDGKTAWELACRE